MGVQIGSVFLLTVRGEDLRLEGRLERVVPVAAGPGRIMTRVEITNTGNVHMFPEGEVELMDEDGNVVGHFTLSETTAILPGETKSFYLDGAESVPDGDYHASGSIQYGWNEDQIAAAEVEPEEWKEQESSREITFNSVPKLRVVEVRMEGSSESGAEVTLAVENYGDVEVSPAGFLDILNDEGERASLLRLDAGSWSVEPHSTATRKYVHRDAMPKGEYRLDVKLAYNGEETAAARATAIIEQDIVPPVSPQAPEARRLQYAPPTPGWVWIALTAAGLVAAIAALGVVGMATGRLRFQAAGNLPTAGGDTNDSGADRCWKDSSLRDGPQDHSSDNCRHDVSRRR